MDQASTLAQSVHATDGKSAYDNACKQLLSEKSILAWIMQTCLEEYRNCDVKEVEKYIEGTPQVSEEAVFPNESSPLIQGTDTTDKSLTEGTITYDIRFFAVTPADGEQIRIIINVEAQNDFNPGYPLLKRAIYYCSRMISSQHGREFTHSHYEKIKKVYSIFICMDPTKQRENTITRYRMTEENLVGELKEPIHHYDLLSVVLLCLGDAEKEAPNKLLKLLNTLLSSETGELEKRRVLEEDFDIPMTYELESEVSTMCNLSQGVEEKGIQKGAQKERISILKKLVQSGKMSLDEALETLDIPKTDWQGYHKLLAEQ